MNTGSNVKKALNVGVIKDVSEILPDLPHKETKSSKLNFKFSSSSLKSTSTFNVVPYHHYNQSQQQQHVPIARRPTVSDMLVSEWIDPSSFIEIAPAATSEANEFRHSQPSSPMCLETANQSALFNIAVMEEDDRVIRMRQRLKSLQETLPNVLGPLKIDFINVKTEKEPAHLPSPLKEVNTFSKESPQMVSLPPIFNHPI